MRTNGDGYFMSEKKTKFKITGLPKAQGLYNPINEHDACGVGLVLDIKNRPSFDIVEKGLAMLCNLEHRGAVGADPKAGDGSGLLIQITPVVIHPIVKPLNLVIISPNHAYWRLHCSKRPPIISPNPAPISPYATTHQTR